LFFVLVLHFQQTVLTVVHILQCCAVSLSVCTECIVVRPRAEVILTAYKKSYMRNWLVPKWMTLTVTFV